MVNKKITFLFRCFVFVISENGFWSILLLSNNVRLCGCFVAKAGDTVQKTKLGQEIGKAAAEKSRGLFSADDWQCNK